MFHVQNNMETQQELTTQLHSCQFASAASSTCSGLTESPQCPQSSVHHVKQLNTFQSQLIFTLSETTCLVYGCRAKCSSPLNFSHCQFATWKMHWRSSCVRVCVCVAWEWELGGGELCGARFIIHVWTCRLFIASYYVRVSVY